MALEPGNPEWAGLRAVAAKPEGGSVRFEQSNGGITAIRAVRLRAGIGRAGYAGGYLAGLLFGAAPLVAQRGERVGIGCADSSGVVAGAAGLGTALAFRAMSRCFPLTNPRNLTQTGG